MAMIKSAFRYWRGYGVYTYAIAEMGRSPIRSEPLVGRGDQTTDTKSQYRVEGEGKAFRWKFNKWKRANITKGRL